MSELPEIEDSTFKLATGEELVMPGPDELVDADQNGAFDQAQAPMAAPVGGVRPPGMNRPSIARPTFRDRRMAGRLRARKVRRLVRHVEPWSVLKISLIFYFCLWVIMLIAGVILWNLAVSSGTVDNIEKFITELFALESFTFNADQIFRASAIGGLVLVVAGSGFTVLMAVLFNLISDVTGGMRFTVVEEETARPRPKRIRPRKSLIERATGARMPAGPPAAMLPPQPLLESDESPAPQEHGVVDGIPILPTVDSTADYTDTDEAGVATAPPDR